MNSASAPHKIAVTMASSRFMRSPPPGGGRDGSGATPAPPSSEGEVSHAATCDRGSGGQRATLPGAPGDEVPQRLVDRGIERRLLVVGQELLPDPVGALSCIERAGLAPGLEVAPVGEHRGVERRFV